MADELLEALAKRQRESDAKDPPIPLDAFEGDAGDALLDDLFGELDEKAGQTPAPSATVEVPSNVTTLPNRRSAAWAAAGIAVAVAAALLLWLAKPSPATELPGYSAVSLAGGPAAVRGDHEDVPEAIELGRPDDSIDWRFSPAVPVEGEVEVVLSARLATGERVFAAVPNPTVSSSGSVRLRGPLNGFIELGEGHWTVEVIFARPGHAPASAEEAKGDDWPRLPIEVIIDAP